MDTIVFDIDGTLADVGHRRHHVTGGNKEWGRFFAEMVNDPPLRDVCLLAELLGDHPLVNQGAIKLFIFSGRPETHRAETEEWLSVHARSLLEKAEGVLMRGADDKRADTIVKKEMLEHVRSMGYDVRLVVDDRPSVVEMWKAEGVTCLQHVNGLDEWDAKPRVEPGVLRLMVGPSGAGKSFFIRNTLYEKWEGGLLGYRPADPGEIVSSDELRKALTGDFRDQSKNAEMWAVLHGIVRTRINGGLDTLVDATNLHSRDRRALRDLCPTNTEIHYYVIDRPLANKHRMAGWRSEVRINGVLLVDKHHASFQNGKKFILRGDDDPRVTVHDYRS